MTDLGYDKIFSATVDGEKVRYGILFGNEKIVFIKAGVPRDVEEDEDKEKRKDEYVDKYLIMAHRVHARIGATVICASNCDSYGNKQLVADRAFIKKVIADLGAENCELYFVGTSDGGDHALKLSCQFEKTAKFLGINSSWGNIDNFTKRIQSLTDVKKIFVYGTNDVDFNDIVPRLKTMACDNLEIVILDGIDHSFTDRADDFIELIDLI